MIILGFDYPDDCYFDLDNDMWCRELGDGRLQVGVSAFGVKISGNHFYMCRPKPVGNEVEQGKTVGVVELSKTVVTIKTPVAGTIVEINTALEETPELIHQDPYGAGWISVIQASDWERDRVLLAHGAALVELAERRMRLEPVDDWIKP
ncbi:glycine cleavage system protein H [Massilia aurea]|uniref:glycine cleavage system protein H n=1 Tax=Massilia aurea TaxID=373040 RepID=UPI0034636DE4